jgi:hypothetical protein
MYWHNMLNVAGTLGVTGVATFSAAPIYSSLTASSAVATDASKALVSVTNTGTGNNVLATSPTLVTPILGTPQSGTLTNATGLPLTKVKRLRQHQLPTQQLNKAHTTKIYTTSKLVHITPTLRVCITWVVQRLGLQTFA